MKGVFPFMNVAINISLSFGVKIAQRFGHKLIMLIGVVTIAISVFCCSFITSFGVFVAIYAVLVGVSSGLIYMVPVICGWRYFPEKKGTLSTASLLCLLGS